MSCSQPPIPGLLWKQSCSTAKNRITGKNISRRDHRNRSGFFQRLGKKRGLKPKFQAFTWRRVRDLNPRTAHHGYTISSRAPSTTQPTLHTLFTCSPERIYPFLSATIFIIAHEAGSVKPFLTFSAKNFFRFSNRSKRQAGGQKEHGHTQQTAQQSQPDAGQHRAAIPPHRIPEAAPSRLLPGQK